MQVYGYIGGVCVSSFLDLSVYPLKGRRGRLAVHCVRFQRERAVLHVCRRHRSEICLPRLPMSDEAFDRTVSLKDYGLIRKFYYH